MLVLGLLGCPPGLEAEKGLIGLVEWREAVRAGNTLRLETVLQSGRSRGSKSGSGVPSCV